MLAKTKNYRPSDKEPFAEPRDTRKMEPEQSA